MIRNKSKNTTIEDFLKYIIKNHINLVTFPDWSIGFILKPNKGIDIKDMIYVFKRLSLDSTRKFWNM